MKTFILRDARDQVLLELIMIQYSRQTLWSIPSCKLALLQITMTSMVGGSAQIGGLLLIFTIAIARQTNTRGLCRVKIARSTLTRPLPAFPSPLACVTRDGVSQTITRACSVSRALTKQKRGIQTVFSVQQTQPRLISALSVSAMLAGRARTITAQAAWLVNIRPAMGLRHVPTVQPGNTQI